MLTLFSELSDNSCNSRVIIAAVIPAVIAAVDVIAFNALLVYNRKLRSQLQNALARPATTAGSRPTDDNHAQRYEFVTVASSKLNSASAADKEQTAYTPLDDIGNGEEIYEEVDAK